MTGFDSNGRLMTVWLKPFVLLVWKLELQPSTMFCLLLLLLFFLPTSALSDLTVLDRTQWTGSDFSYSELQSKKFFFLSWRQAFPGESSLHCREACVCNLEQLAESRLSFSSNNLCSHTAESREEECLQCAALLLAHTLANSKCAEVPSAQLMWSDSTWLTWLINL